MNLANIIENTNGKFFGVTFVKNDGTIREMQARTGVTKYLVNPGAAPKNKTAQQQKYINVYDCQKKGYRSINRDTILSVRCEGVEIYRRGA